MAPRGPRAKRLHFPGAARRLAAQPTASPRVTLASPVAPQPGPTAPPSNLPTSVEPPVAATARPLDTSAVPATAAGRALAVEEAPERVTDDSTLVEASSANEGTEGVQAIPELPSASLAKAVSPVPAVDVAAPDAPVPAAPLAQSTRAATSARRGRLRAKRRAAAALARKLKQQENIITALRQANAPTEAPQVPTSAPASETPPSPPAVEDTRAVDKAEFISLATEAPPAGARSGTPTLAEPTAAVNPPPPTTPMLIPPPPRSTISRTPKKRRFFAGLEEDATSGAVLPSSPLEAVAKAPPVAEVPRTAPANTPIAPAVARTTTAHRISKKRENRTVGGPPSTRSALCTEASPEVTATPTAAVQENTLDMGVPTSTVREASVAPPALVAQAPPLSPPQTTDTLPPQPTLPGTSSATEASTSGRATMGRVQKRKKRFFAELHEAKESPTPPSSMDASNTPVVDHAAVALSSGDVAVTTATAEPIAPVMETATTPPATPVSVPEVPPSKPVAMPTTLRRHGRKRARLPSRVPLAEAPLTAKTPCPEASLSTPVAPTPVTEAVPAMRVAPSVQPAGEATNTTQRATLVEASTSSAMQCNRGIPKAQIPKKKVKHLTAAAIRRRELAAYNRIPKRFRPPEPPLSVPPTPASPLEHPPASTAAHPLNTASETEKVVETQQTAAVVSAREIDSQESAAQICTEEQVPAAMETVVERIAFRPAQTPSNTNTTSIAAFVKRAMPVAETEKSPSQTSAPAEQHFMVDSAIMATKMMKGRITKSPRKRSFTTLEEAPIASSTETATSVSGSVARSVEWTHAAEAMEAQRAVRQTYSAVETVESAPRETSDDAELHTEAMTVVEEAVAQPSPLMEADKTASVTPMEANTSTEAPLPMTDSYAGTTHSAEFTSFEKLEEAGDVKAPLTSDSAAEDMEATLSPPKKVVRVTNVRAMLKEIRKSKRLSKRRSSKKHRNATSALQGTVTALTTVVDEVACMEAPDSLAEAPPLAEAADGGMDTSEHKEESVEATQEKVETTFSVAEQQSVVEPEEVEATVASELDVEMSVGATTVEHCVTEVEATTPADEEVALPHTEARLSQAHAVVAAPAADPLPAADTSLSPARRQAAKQKIKKHAKMAAARLKKRQTYAASAATFPPVSCTPVEALDRPLVEAVHAAAEPPIPPAEESSAAELVRSAALTLPSGNVVIESFTDDEMCLRRATLDDSWDVGLRFDWQERTLVISSFPTFEATDKRAAHPFVQRFRSKPRWMLKEVNETSAAHMRGALDSLKRSLTARFVFRHWK